MLIPGCAGAVAIPIVYGSQANIFAKVQTRFRDHITGGGVYHVLQLCQNLLPGDVERNVWVEHSSYSMIMNSIPAAEEIVGLLVDSSVFCSDGHSESSSALHRSE